MTTPIDALVAIDAADVYVDGQLVAVMQRRPTLVEFRYLPSVPPHLAVASTLPVGGEPVVTPGRAVPPYFAGLLPEGRRLTALRTPPAAGRAQRSAGRVEGPARGLDHGREDAGRDGSFDRPKASRHRSDDLRCRRRPAWQRGPGPSR